MLKNLINQELQGKQTYDFFPDITQEGFLRTSPILQYVNPIKCFGAFNQPAFVYRTNQHFFSDISDGQVNYVKAERERKSLTKEFKSLDELIPVVELKTEEGVWRRESFANQVANGLPLAINKAFIQYVFETINWTEATMADNIIPVTINGASKPVAQQRGLSYAQIELARQRLQDKGILLDNMNNPIVLLAPYCLRYSLCTDTDLAYNALGIPFFLSNNDYLAKTIRCVTVFMEDYYFEKFREANIDGAGHEGYSCFLFESKNTVLGIFNGTGTPIVSDDELAAKEMFREQYVHILSVPQLDGSVGYRAILGLGAMCLHPERIMRIKCRLTAA